EPTDVDYTFIGVNLVNGEIDVSSNDLDICSVVGPYAYNHRLLNESFYQKYGQVTVRARNTNTDVTIHSTFNVDRSQAIAYGSDAFSPALGIKSRVLLELKTAKEADVLPTGHRVDRVLGHHVSCINGISPCVFLRADELGIDNTNLLDPMQDLPKEALRKVEAIRSEAAVRIGLATSPLIHPNKFLDIVIISTPSTCKLPSGEVVNPANTDLFMRGVALHTQGRPLPLHEALTTAVAAQIQDSIVEQLLPPELAYDDVITLGHASGRIQVNATIPQGSK
ncbi:hypothetical protein EJ04DRAFT_421656, partial [Polyplosphaeria fusca]